MYVSLRPPREIKTEVRLPSSKSISNRALVIYALSTGGKVDDSCVDTVLRNLSDCDDTYVLRCALTQLPETVDIMAAGTAMRFLTAYFAVTEGTHVITGTERMRHRPIGILVDALRALGADIEYTGQDGYPPLRVTGRTLKCRTLDLPANVSSQYVSALMMIGPQVQGGLTLRLGDVVMSRPYICMTKSIMEAFGAQVEWSADNVIRMEQGGYRTVPYYIESDWSAASYWFQMMALSDNDESEVLLPGLFEESLQGDSVVRTIFGSLGVCSEFVRDLSGVETLRLTRKETACAEIDLDMSGCPDLAQTLAVTAAMLDIPFRLSGLRSLKIKETDRMAALETELGKLGFVIGDLDNDVLYWDGRHSTPQTFPTIDTYEDHRMAMCMAPVALKTGLLRINDPEVVSKSYPGYWDDMEKAGFKIVKS